MLIKFVINKDLVPGRKRPWLPCYASLIRISAIIRHNESKLLNYFVQFSHCRQLREKILVKIPVRGRC